MCEICEEVLSHISAEQLNTLEKLSVEAEEYGHKIMKELVACGFLKMRAGTFSVEQIAAGINKRTEALFALAAIAGFTSNAAIHDPNIALNADQIYEMSAKVGWAAGHRKEEAPRH